MLNAFARFTRERRRLVIYDQLNPAYAKYYSRDEATRCSPARASPMSGPALPGLQLDRDRDQARLLTAPRDRRQRGLGSHGAGAVGER